MEPTQLQKIKALLPIEVTAAFIAIQRIVNGELDPVTNLYPGANLYFFEMLALLLLLCLCNLVLVRRGGEDRVGMLVFSTVGFVIWAINLDIVRWEDRISEVFSAAPGGFLTSLFLPILAVLYSLSAAILTVRN